MTQFTDFTKRTATVGMVVFTLLIMPASTLAAGITKPTGADAVTYSYNEKTGLWENQYYTWSPETKKYTPKFSQTYTYNSATGKYDTTTFAYNPSAGKFEAVNKSVDTPPAGATVIGGPPPVATITDTGSGSDNSISDNNQTTGSRTISNTGTDSTNKINNNNNSQLDHTSSSSTTVDNQIVATANSGDAAVTQNTSAGSATSGSAKDTATVVNQLQSDTSLQGTTTTFTYDIYGNVQGDITIDPSQLSSVDTDIPNASPTDVTINTSQDASINNDIQLTATSGDATVARNTKAGNATSGTAQAVANILNVINSIISSGQSFIGTINIYGNFDGDILLPQDTLNKVLASNYPTINATVTPDGSVSVINNTGPGSSNSINNNSSGSTDINSQNTTGINNRVNLAASSGDATVARNTTAGNAATGTATTNLVLLNLTGQQIICGDALLVFVNVLGNWVGMIVNAPSGATAAALGGHCSGPATGGSGANSSMSGTGNSSSNTIDNSDNSATSINDTGNLSINNNLSIKATSGNADVIGNTEAGNAISGDASASANIANIANSAMSFSDWFGLLFINVFGLWNGSFGINTAAGNPATAASGNESTGHSANQTDRSAVKVFQFVPSEGGGITTSSSVSTTPPTTIFALAHNNVSYLQSHDSRGQTLAASTNNSNGGPLSSNGSSGKTAWIWIVSGLVVLTLFNLPDRLWKKMTKPFRR